MSQLEQETVSINSNEIYKLISDDEIFSPVQNLLNNNSVYKMFESTGEITINDLYTRGHSERVSAYSVLIGEQMGLSKKEEKILKFGGFFHDIGKNNISNNILLKETKLTDEEYSEMKTHTTIGVKMFSNNIYFKDVLPIIEYHHEKYDGTGYPSKLKGEQIPLLARIIAVADSFDAMTSSRSYRSAMSIDYAINEMQKCKGTQFDPKIVDAFLEIINNQPDKIKKIQDDFNM